MALVIRWTLAWISRLVARPTTRCTKLCLINVSVGVLSCLRFSKAWDVHMKMSRGLQAQGVLRSWVAVHPCCRAAAACSASMAARSHKVHAVGLHQLVVGLPDPGHPLG